MDIKLSSELWLLIAAGLPTEDLSRLGRCSRYLLQILRPALYRNTILRDKVFEATTVMLLARDPFLASSIKRFRYVLKIFAMVETILTMSNLIDLSIGLSFEDDEAQQSFVNYFKSREQPLEALTIYATSFHSDHFEIPGLRSLGWKTSSRPQLQSVLTASRGTLTQVELSHQAVNTADPLDPFWSLRFPRLRLLKIPSLDDTVLQGDGDRTDFFVAHASTLQEIFVKVYPPLRNLKLSFCLPDPEQNEEASPARLTIRSLAFDAAWSMLVVARYVPRYTDKLERLELIIDGSYPPEHCFSPLESLKSAIYVRFALMPPGPATSFPALREFCIPFWYEHHTLEDWRRFNCTPDTFIDHIRQQAALFGPLIEILSGCLPPIEGLTPEALGEALSSFPHLKQIAICDVAVGGFDSAEEYAIKLASTCISLEVIDIKDSADGTSSGMTLEIGRGYSLPPQIVKKAWVRSFQRDVAV